MILFLLRHYLLGFHFEFGHRPPLHSLPPTVQFINDDVSLALIKSTPTKTEGLVVGARVEARFKKEKAWYPGYITKLHEVFE